MVIDMAIDDAGAAIAALAEPETLLVFGVLAVRTSRLRVNASGRSGPGTSYVTPFGLMRETSLSRDVVEAAAGRLKRAGLVEVLVDDEGGYEAGGSARPLWLPRRPHRWVSSRRRAVYDPGNRPVAGTNVTISAR
jgi:hypothetical protein